MLPSIGCIYNNENTLGTKSLVFARLKAHYLCNLSLSESWSNKDSSHSNQRSQDTLHCCRITIQEETVGTTSPNFSIFHMKNLDHRYGLMMSLQVTANPKECFRWQASPTVLILDMRASFRKKHSVVAKILVYDIKPSGLLFCDSTAMTWPP